MLLNTNYIKTKAGIFKCVNVTVGLVSVALIGAGHHKHGSASLPSVYCFDEFRPCGHIWAGELGMSLVIIAWLYSVGILLLSTFTQWSSTVVIFRWLDIYGHLVFGIVLIVANIFIIIYLVTVGRLTCHLYVTYEIYPLHVNDTVTCPAHHLFVVKFFVLWVLGQIFSVVLVFFFNVTWYVVKRQGAVLEPERAVTPDEVQIF